MLSSSCVELTPITNEELSSHPKRNTKTIFPEKKIYSFIGILSLHLLFTKSYGHKYCSYITRHKLYCYAAAAAAKSLQSRPTLCDPIDGSSPGSPVPGILQAKTLEWVAISFSNARK